MNTNNSSKEVTVKVPIALEQLIRTSNELLKNYQTKLMERIQLANSEIMEIFNLDPSAGWTLDMERMVYTRPLAEEDTVKK
jgi:hypothetical protein